MGLKNATAEWVLFLDADDEFLLTGLLALGGKLLSIDKEYERINVLSFDWEYASTEIFSPVALTVADETSIF